VVVDTTVAVTGAVSGVGATTGSATGSATGSTGDEGDDGAGAATYVYVATFCRDPKASCTSTSTTPGVPNGVIAVSDPSELTEKLAETPPKSTLEMLDRPHEFSVTPVPPHCVPLAGVSVCALVVSPNHGEAQPVVPARYDRLLSGVELNELFCALGALPDARTHLSELAYSKELGPSVDTPEPSPTLVSARV
jgi:hypothetical protein